MGELFCLAPSQVSSISWRSWCQSVSAQGTAGKEPSLDRVSKCTPGSGGVNWSLEVTPKRCFEKLVNRQLEMCIAQCGAGNASRIFWFAIRELYTVRGVAQPSPGSLSSKIWTVKRALTSDLRQKSADCCSSAYSRTENYSSEGWGWFGSRGTAGPHSAHSPSFTTGQIPCHQLQGECRVRNKWPGAAFQTEQLINGKTFCSHKTQW